MPDSVGELGEFGLIGAVTARLPQGPDVLLGPGDDSAVVAAPDGRVVVTTDLLVENRHFRRDWSDAADVGHKAAAQNLSDIEAMGARPTSLVVGLGVPADLPVDWAVGLMAGLGEEASLVGASVVGGDVVRSPLVVVSVTALGSLDGVPPVTRSGARPGDVVAVCGRLGWAEAGYQVLSRGFRTPRAVVEAHRRPAVPYGAGREAAELGATAMCDVSDGLLGDLGHVASASGVSVDVDAASLVVAPQLREVASALGADPLAWVLTGGDDNALVACFPVDVEVPERWTVIGSVSAGSGVTVDGSAYDGAAGHDHFAG
ncbi:thiamine-phosphate kinase [Jiangella ureilytica]|uniref:Thiamine-monophosphate kinase n=1 Tax=Jiangella ureilytica TaxID=2530374 RepID=A0A4R4S2C1_9ACTN|nr:thiamine-phosphate kinase [Jiangella ureilytica]TDC56897.1 thiamine-phosphate kinase [Jiangella ureilytica]